MLILYLLCLILGFIILVYGADFLVDGSSALAKRMNMPVIIIALTIVAFGTSAPELVVNVIAAINGKDQLPLANVLGSNIFNILGALGATAIVCPFVVKKTSRRIDVPMAIFAALLVLIFALDNAFNFSEGLVLLLCFLLFMTYTVVLTLHRKGKKSADEEIEIHNYSFVKCLLFTFLGFAGLIIGGKMLVEGAVYVAAAVGISERIIGLTIVSIGTSLPELVTSLVAARKGNSDIAIGNIVGSNIINTFLILGCSVVICPINVREDSVVDLFLNLGASVLVLLFIYGGRRRRITKLEGYLLVLTYLAYMSYLVWQTI